jgi:hypothetical protein
MKKKLPFEVNYTNVMSKKFNDELRESGNCFVSNPKFYGKWELLEVGSPEYVEKLKVKRKDIEKEG